MKIIISAASQQPIYQQIIDQVKQEILQGNLSSGELMPSIRNLAKELKISVITTKKAYEELEREGFLVTTAGKGTFVAPQNMELLKETRLREIEESLGKAVELAKSVGIGIEELEEILRLMYEEE